MTLRALLLAMCTGSLPTAAIAQDQLAIEEPVFAATKLSDVSWLVGDWEGKDNEGDRVVERWLAPIGGVMIGTYVQTKRDDAGTISVDWSEHLHLQEEGGTIVLTTVTVQAGFELQPPIASQKRAHEVEPCRIAFKDLTLECSDPDKPGEGLRVTYGEDFMNDGTGVFTLTYRKVGND